MLSNTNNQNNLLIRMANQHKKPLQEELVQQPPSIMSDPFGQGGQTPTPMIPSLPSTVAPNLTMPNQQGGGASIGGSHSQSPSFQGIDPLSGIPSKDKVPSFGEFSIQSMDISFSPLSTPNPNDRVGQKEVQAEHHYPIPPAPSHLSTDGREALYSNPSHTMVSPPHPINQGSIPPPVAGTRTVETPSIPMIQTHRASLEETLRTQGNNLEVMQETHKKVETNRLIDSLTTYTYQEIAKNIPNFYVYDEKIRDSISDKLKKEVEEWGRIDKDKYTSDEKKKQIKRDLKEKAKKFAFSLIKGIYEKENVEYTDGMIQVYVKYLIDDMYDYSILTDLLDDESITEIMAPEYRKVFIEKDGKIRLTNLSFRDMEHMKDVIDRITSQLGRKLNDTTPNLDARLADKSRVSASVPPIAVNGPELTIRKFPKRPWSGEKLISFGSMNEEMFSFLKSIVKIRCRSMVSGGTGSGKTTLLNILSNYMNEEDRILVLENVAELNLQLPHVVYQEERIGSTNDVLLKDLVINALRKRPDAIVVGEVRGPECLYLIRALSTGHYGFGTIHADSAKEMFSTMMALIWMAGVNWEVPVVNRVICSGLDFVIQVSRIRDGSRKIMTISEVLGVDDEGAFRLGKVLGVDKVHDSKRFGFGHVYLHDIYKFVETGEDANQKVIGHWERSKHRPYRFRELQRIGGLPDFWKNEEE